MKLRLRVATEVPNILAHRHETLLRDVRSVLHPALTLGQCLVGHCDQLRSKLACQPVHLEDIVVVDLGQPRRQLVETGRPVLLRSGQAARFGHQPAVLGDRPVQQVVRRAVGVPGPVVIAVSLGEGEHPAVTAAARAAVLRPVRIGPRVRLPVVDRHVIAVPGEFARGDQVDDSRAYQGHRRHEAMLRVVAVWVFFHALPKGYPYR